MFTLRQRGPQQLAVPLEIHNQTSSEIFHVRKQQKNVFNL